MDEFRTAEEKIFRRRARSYFLRLAGPPGSKALDPPERIWRDLEGPGGPDSAAATGPGVSLSDRVSIIEEAAFRAPKLGRDLLAWRAALSALDPAEEGLFRFGRLAGTAAHVLDAGTLAARDRGAFSSSLMGCREIQESLADLAATTERLRLGTCRICRLLDRGERDLADAECARLRDLALLLSRDLLSVARALLGEPWVEANLPEDDLAPDNERTST